MQLFPEPAPDFTDPLGMLRACHQRMLDNCVILEKLIEHIQQHGVDKDAQTAAAKIHRYFSTSALHHHEDEEQDLFPHLPPSELISKLLQEHEILAQSWTKLEPQLCLLREGKHAAEYTNVVTPFIAGYRQHIAIENSQLLPRAAEILSKQQLKSMGENMQQRRA